MTSRWVGHEVVDNATVGRLETMIDQFENLDPAERNLAYLAESRARDALLDVKLFGASMEAAQERVKTAWRTMSTTRNELESALIANGNAEELTDKLQDAGTYVLAVVSVKFIAASATVALVAGTTLTVLGEVNDALRSEGEPDVPRDVASNVATAVGTTDDVLGVLDAAKFPAARPAFGGALTVASGIGDAFEAFTSEPVIAQLQGNTSQSFADLRAQIDRQSWFSNKGELRELTSKAESAQNRYNDAVRDLNRKTVLYARALAAARQITYSKPR